MTLPPGVSASRFKQALDEFAGAIGKAWVFSEQADVDLYRDAYSVYWDEPEERRASAALAPASVEEVQQLVRIANKYKVPLYPVSTGRNLAYGGSAPSMTGSVVLDLKRMNRIIEVDDKRNFAIVEPGVSYFDLYSYIQEKGLKVWLDVPGPGWGSLMGNALDRGIGSTYGFHRDHWGAHCGLEAVLPNGELMRTGMGAVPGAQSWAENRYGFGPWVDGLFSQGAFGVVTKMGFWLFPEPESYSTGSIDVPRYQDLVPLVEVVNYLEDSGMVGRPQYMSQAGGAMRGPLEPRLKAMLQSGWPTHDQLTDYAKSLGRPCWTATLSFYGAAEANAANWAAAKKRVAKAIPGATFRDGRRIDLPLTPEQLQTAPKGAFGIPALEIFNLPMRTEANNANPPFGHTDFSLIIPRTGEAVFKSNEVLGKVYLGLGLEPQVTPFTAPLLWHMRSFINAPVVFTYHDAVQNKAARALFNGMMDAAAEHGWAQYRAHAALHDRVMSKYSFNNNALLRFIEALKDGIDPNGVISPGRSGVWPKAFRAQRPRLDKA